MGVDIDVGYNTFRGKRSPEMTAKWDSHLPILIKDVLSHGRVLEETFDRLGYEIDKDLNGNEYPLSTAVFTQHQRQRATDMTHQVNLEGFRQLELVKIVGKESDTAAIAVEKRWREEQLLDNKKVEVEIYKYLNRDLEKDELFTDDDPLPTEVLAKQGIKLNAFVRVGRMTHQRMTRVSGCQQRKGMQTS